MNTTIERLDAAIADARAKLERLIAAREVLAELGGGVAASATADAHPAAASPPAAPIAHSLTPPAAPALPPPCACGSHAHDAAPLPTVVFEEGDVARVRLLKCLVDAGPRKPAELARMSGSSGSTLRDALESLFVADHARRQADGITWEATDAGRAYRAGVRPVPTKPTWERVLDLLGRQGPLVSGDICRTLGLTPSQMEKAITQLNSAGRIVKVGGRGPKAPWAVAGTAATTNPAPPPGGRRVDGGEAGAADLRANADLDAAFADDGDLFMPRPRVVPPSPKGSAPAPTGAGAESMSVRVIRLLTASGPTRFSDMKRELDTTEGTLGTALRRLVSKGRVRKQSEDDPRSPWELVPATTAAG